ncbi:hypothetical protein F183_A16990 [Bryobacterales bacterium F-183]|nr:hypothetical protein F183_A16990 [Bryobacterales bacterium F-183]
MSITSSTPSARTRAIALAQHVLREKLDKWPDLQRHEQVFRLILARTEGTEKSDLEDLLPDPDERTIRRWVKALNAVLRAGFAAAGCIYALQAVEGQAGHQSESQKKLRHTFTILANEDLQKLSYRKCWTGIFANSLNAQAYPVNFIYPLCDNTARTLTAGTAQLLKHLSRSFLMNGIDMEDTDAASFRCDDLREPGSNLILVGTPAQNPHVQALEFPEALDLTWDPEARAINNAQTEDGQDIADSLNEGPRAVHVLVSVFAPAWMQDARIWVFQAMEDRAYEAMGLYFSSDANLDDLAIKLGVKPSEEFPSRLQLVFRVHLNAKGQLRNKTGDVMLMDYVGATGPVTGATSGLPRKTNGKQPANLRIAASGGKTV